MIMLIVVILVGVGSILPALIYFLHLHRRAPARASRGLLRGLRGFNLIVGLLAAGFGLVWLATPTTVSALAPGGAAATTDPYASLAAALAIGFGVMSSGYAVSSTGSAAIGAIAEKPESAGRALIFVGLAEGIAIYALIIAFIILNR
jgi:V/A-type H+-transporting ATPase subunit K